MSKKKIVIDSVRKFADTIHNKPCQCLHVAHYTAEALYHAGYSPMIQAGSLQWPRIKPEEDDGIRDTHFSYIWSPYTEASVRSVENGHLPEMHVWVFMMEKLGKGKYGYSLVDFSTKYLKAAAKLMNLDWSAEDPPDYLWTLEKDMPPRTVYTANKEATEFACELLWDLYEPDYLQSYKQISDLLTR